MGFNTDYSLFQIMAVNESYCIFYNFHCKQNKYGICACLYCVGHVHVFSSLEAVSY